jgi:ABC-type transport system involved in cytochrome c biogenesis permease subunit
MEDISMGLARFVFLIILLAVTSVKAAELSFCSDEYDTLPIQQNGRVKPLYVHASESLKELTGSTTVDKFSPVFAYCLLSLNGVGVVNDLNLEAKIEHKDLKNYFNMKKGEDKISYEKLIGVAEALRQEMRTIKDNESYRKSIIKLMNNIGLYQEIKSGNDWTLAENINNQISWQPINLYLTDAKVLAEKNNFSTTPVNQVILNSKNIYENIKGNRYIVEYYYAKMQLVYWALFLTAIALAVLVVFKTLKIAEIIIQAIALIQVILIGLRVYISGRAPITNMYETVLSSGTGGLILSILLAKIHKQKTYYYLGLIYNFCSLMMLSFANGMLTGKISPLVPVLRDNFWLSTHVTTVILSYGALALSWVMANIAIFKKYFNGLSSDEETHFGNHIYSILKWGTTMLAAGIILGGVWADYSWGRFWGWDPKETWSLIVLCIYIAILHGRYTAWITNKNFFIITAMSFLSVMMAWFGVNYILATGLHSYGFSEGGALFLASFFCLQTIVVLISKIKIKSIAN